MEFGGLRLEWVKSYFSNGSQFVEFNNYRFLGVLLDDNVTWKSHLSFVATKMSKTYRHHS